MADGDQLIISVNGGVDESVTFSANAAMTVAELKALVEAAISGVTVEPVGGGTFEIRTVDAGPTATIQVGAATAAVFGLDNDLHTGSDTGSIDVIRVEGKDPGAYAERIEVEVREATSGEADTFDLAVVEDGVYRETFVNLVLDPDAARYVETILNNARSGSTLIRVTLPGETRPSAPNWDRQPIFFSLPLQQSVARARWGFAEYFCEFH